MTRQQTWSLAAHGRVREAAGHENSRAEYRTHCMKTPTLLQQSGVTQTLAFLLSRRGETPEAFANDLAHVYLGRGDWEGAAKRLLALAQEEGLAGYLTMTRDLIEVATWFRRFAQIEIPSSGNDE